MSDEISLPETAAQLSEQSLQQPLSWKPLTWVFVGALVVTFCLRRGYKVYSTCFATKSLQKTADEIEDTLRRFRTNSLLGPDTGCNTGSSPIPRICGELTSQRWMLALELEERVMSIQETILDISLRLHYTQSIPGKATYKGKESFIRNIITDCFQGRIQAIRKTIGCRRELNTLKKEIEILEQTTRLEQLRWNLQLLQLRRSNSTSSKTSNSCISIPLP